MKDNDVDESCRSAISSFACHLALPHCPNYNSCISHFASLSPSFSTLDRVSFWVSLRQEILSIHGYWLQWVERRPLHLLPSQGRRMSHSDWSILRTLTFFKSLQDIDGCGRYTSPFLLITSCSWSSGTSCPSGIIIFATLSNQHSLLLCISRLYAYHGCSICPRSPVCVPSLFGGKSITPKAYYLLFLSIL